jgi:hypothetical protein
MLGMSAAKSVTTKLNEARTTLKTEAAPTATRGLQLFYGLLGFIGMVVSIAPAVLSWFYSPLIVFQIVFGGIFFFSLLALCYTLPGVKDTRYQSKFGTAVGGTALFLLVMHFAVQTLHCV